MSYTIRTASFANAENSAAVINTEEVGHKAISAADTPDAWAEMLVWQAAGNRIRPYGEGAAYKAAREREAALAVRKADAERKIAALGLTADDIKAILA